MIGDCDDGLPAPQTDFLEPPTGARKIRSIGPGLLAAATGVGAGDLVATMVAGASFGTVLLWAAVVGTLVKLALGEAVGRWHLGSGATMLDGWRRLGYWATGFFGVYIVVWGFVYGATAMSAVGLPSTRCSADYRSAGGRRSRASSGWCWCGCSATTPSRSS